MDTNEIMMVGFEACVGYVGDGDEPCDECGWLEDDHRDKPNEVEIPALPLAA